MNIITAKTVKKNGDITWTKRYLPLAKNYYSREYSKQKRPDRKYTYPETGKSQLIFGYGIRLEELGILQSQSIN